MKFLAQHDGPAIFGEEDGEEDQFYHLEDFEIGCSVWVGGREVVVYDCDEATRDYYREVVGRGERYIWMGEETDCLLLFYLLPLPLLLKLSKC